MSLNDILELGLQTKYFFSYFDLNHFLSLHLVKIAK